jgi:hypothetical protein
MCEGSYRAITVELSEQVPDFIDQSPDFLDGRRIAGFVLTKLGELDVGAFALALFESAQQLGGDAQLPVFFGLGPGLSRGKAPSPSAWGVTPSSSLSRSGFQAEYTQPRIEWRSGGNGRGLPRAEAQPCARPLRASPIGSQSEP